jgi:hypothetical protein
MDFILLYTLIGITILLLVLSYDIACQWATNFKTRIPQFPSSMRIPPEIFVIIKYVIPKFHIYGHGARCQYRFSLNFLRWSARTNGEEPERWWAHINPVSMSTKEMSPGSRTASLMTMQGHGISGRSRASVSSSFLSLLAAFLFFLP